MILVSGEALIDLFIGAPAQAGFPAEAIYLWAGSPPKPIPMTRWRDRQGR